MQQSCLATSHPLPQLPRLPYATSTPRTKHRLRFGLRTDLARRPQWLHLRPPPRLPSSTPVSPTTPQSSPSILHPHPRKQAASPPVSSQQSHISSQRNLLTRMARITSTTSRWRRPNTPMPHPQAASRFCALQARVSVAGYRSAICWKPKGNFSTSTDLSLRSSTPYPRMDVRHSTQQ